MPGNKNDTAATWVDSNDAPDLTDEVFQRAALKDRVRRPAKGTLTKRGRPKILRTAA